VQDLKFHFPDVHKLVGDDGDDGEEGEREVTVERAEVFRAKQEAPCMGMSDPESLVALLW